MVKYELTNQDSPKKTPPTDAVSLSYHSKDGGLATSVATSNGEAITDAKNVDSGEKKDSKEKKAVSISTLFRFADGIDKVLMFFGCLAGLVTGSLLPISMILFGGITDVFVDESYNNALRDAIVENVTMGCNVTQMCNITADTTIEDIIQILNRTGHQNLSETLAGLVESTFMDTMQEYAIKYTVLGVIMLITAYVEIVCFATSSHRQSRRIRRLLLWSVLRQDIGWFDTYEPAELTTRLADDVDKIQEGTGDKLALLFQYVSVILAGLIVGFIYGWKLTLVMLAVSPLIIISGAIMGLVGSVLSTKELKAYAKAGAVAQEVFSCIRTVTAFSGQERENNRYVNHLEEARTFGIKKGYINGVSLGFVFLSLFVVEAFALWYGAQLVFSEEMSAGDMLIVFFSIIFAAFSIGMAGPNIQSLTMAQGAAYEIFKTIDLQPIIDGTSDKGNKPPSLTGTVEFRDVIFRYPSRADVPVLQGLSLTVNVGQTIALVGNSGCGKSTVVQLLQRFYDPLEGEILIDGRSIKDLNVQWLRQRIGVVSQEPVLFATSIAENISYGLEGVTQEEIEVAAKEANAHDFIKMLPKGYNTLVGERGAQLSGGQKQRIAIARALVRNPKILLLDEATSALDTENEAIVQAALDKVRKGRTTFIVAHRLSTIRTADVIAGIKNGIIVEKGTHEELMKMNGVYHQLVTQQTIAGEDNDSENDEEFDIEFKNGINEKGDMVPPYENGFSRLVSQVSSTGDGKRKRMLSESSEGKQSVGKEEEQEAQLADAKLVRMVKLNSPEWMFILLGCIGAAVFGCNQPAFSLLFSDIIGVFGTLDDNKNQEIIRYCVIMVVVGIITGIAMFLQTAMFTRSGEGLTHRLREMAFNAYLRQELAYFDDHRNSTGALCVRLSTDASAVQGATGSRLGTLLQSLANIVAGLLIGFYFSWKLTLILLLFTPFVVLGGFVEMRMLTGRKLEDKTAFDEAGKIATECILNIRTVATLTKEKMFWENYSILLEKPFRRELRNSHVLAGAYAFSQAMYNWAYAAGFMAGAYLVQNGEITYEDMFKVFSAVIFGAVAIGQAFSFAPDYGKAKVAASRLFALFDRQPKIDNNSNDGIQPADVTGETEFKHVRFSYASRPDVPVLRSLNLLCRPAKRLALVGSSGCGKSTVVQLIERFYDPTSGYVTFGNEDIKNLRIQWLRSQMSIVSQEPILFDSTIRENIEYGDNSRKVTMDEVIAAAKMANIHTFITSLPKGYETEVGEKGSMLSGGQKQRVAIARALIRNPKLLLLDEATSALDTESEKIVQEALDKAQEGRTCIVIAHRLSTIHNADCIAVFKQGKVAEIGTHSELLAMKGVYYKLNNAQTGAATNS